MTPIGSGSSPEKISCSREQWFPELSCDSPFDYSVSNSITWACMQEEDGNAGAFDIDYRDYGCGFAGGGECGAELMKKGPWTAEEDERLKKCVEEHGVGNWITIEKYSGLGRSSKSCRLRWTNHLRPNLKKGSFTSEEERLLVKLHQKYGNKWSYIASKLPGRTDNEVKNFWHGRVRRCLRKFQPIYPDNVENGKSCINGLLLEVNRNSHLNGQSHSSSAMDDTESILHFPSSITPHEFEPNDASFQEKPNTIDNQNHPFSSTPPGTQLFSPIQRPVSSPNGLPSSQLPSPRCYTPQTPAPNFYPSIGQFHSAETSDTTSQNPHMGYHQGHCSSSPQQPISQTAVTFSHFRPPPVLCPLVGQLKRSRKARIPLSSPSTITQFSAPEHSSPISASGSSTTSLIRNVASPFPQSTPELHSSRLHLSGVPPATSSHISSMPSDICSFNLNSQNLNTSSTHPDLYLQKNNPARRSLVFPQAWDSLISEPPSVQTPTSAYRPIIPEIKINQLETDVEILDAPTQEARAKADILRNRSLEHLYIDGCWGLTEDPVGKMMENETFKQNVFHQSSRQGDNFSEKTSSLHRLGESSKPEHTTTVSNSGDLVSQRLCRNFSHNKCFKPKAFGGKISRREGLLSEVSKTGALLVERGKKETILKGLLYKSSKHGSLTNKRSKTEDMELGKISKTGKLPGQNFIAKDSLSEMYNRRGSVDQKSAEDVLLYENFTSLRNENFEEFSFSLNLQKQTCDQDAFGEASCAIPTGHDLLASSGQGNEFKALESYINHITEMAFLESGKERDNLKYPAVSNGPLNESLREECPDTLRVEPLLNQAQNDHYIGEDLFIDKPSEDLQGIINESVWDLDQYAITDPLSSTNPPNIWCPIQEGVMKEVSPGSRMKSEISLDNGLNVNEFVSSTSENTASCLLTAGTHCSRTGSVQCFEELKSKLEIEEDYNKLPEDFSNLLEFLPIDLPDCCDTNCETSNISDMILELEMSYHHAIDEIP